MKKKKIIIAIIIGLIVIVAGGISIFMIKRNIDIKNSENKFNDRVKELLENSYDYYYFTYGDVQTTEAAIEVEDKKYYFVNDDKYKTIDNLINVIENTFVPDKLPDYIEKLNSNHEYLEADNKLYVKKSDNICKKEYDIDYNNLKIEDVDEDTKILTWNNTFTYIYLVDNEWYLSTEVFYCVDDSELNDLEEE